MGWILNVNVFLLPAIYIWNICNNFKLIRKLKSYTVNSANRLRKTYFNVDFLAHLHFSLKISKPQAA